MNATNRVVAAAAAVALAAGGSVLVAGPASADREYFSVNRDATDPYSNVLRPNDVLESGEAVMSTNDKYGLRQNEDGNLVLYRAKDKKPVWASYTSGNPGAKTRMNADGNLVVLGQDGKGVWSTKTDGRPNSWLQVMNDGSLVLWGQDGKHQWTDQFHVGELKPGPELKTGNYLASKNREYFLINQEGGNVVLVNKKREPLWATHTHGTDGAVARFQRDGNFVVIDPATGKAVFSTGTDGDGGTSLRLGNDGNLTIQNADGKAVWASNTDQT